MGVLADAYVGAAGLGDEFLSWTGLDSTSTLAADAEAGVESADGTLPAGETANERAQQLGQVELSQQVVQKAAAQTGAQIKKAVAPALDIFEWMAIGVGLLGVGLIALEVRRTFA